MNTYKIKKIRNKILLYIISIIFAIISFFPIYWMICIVFSETGVPIAINPRFWPTSIIEGIGKIQQIFTERGFLRAYYVSFVYGIISCIFGTIIAAMAAFEFSLFRFKGKAVLYAVTLSSLMVPKTVFLVPLYLLCSNTLGWLNSFKGLIIPGLADVFGVFMMVEGMQKLPRDLFDAAEVDGATHFQLFFKVALPLSKNSIFTLIILTFMRTWSNLNWPMIIESNQDYYTVSRIINWFNQPDTWVTTDNIMAANFMSAIPPILIFIFFQQYVIKGIAYTGLKE